MSTISTPVQRNVSLFAVIVMATLFVIALTLVFKPAMIRSNQPALSLTESQNAYVEYIQGEKVMYLAPVWFSEPLSAQQIGEKVLFSSISPAEKALNLYRLGEKTNSVTAADVLYEYRQGEK